MREIITTILTFAVALLQILYLVIFLTLYKKRNFTIKTFRIRFVLCVLIALLFIVQIFIAYDDMFILVSRIFYSIFWIDISYKQYAHLTMQKEKVQAQKIHDTLESLLVYGYVPDDIVDVEYKEIDG